jgi:hypothetical protein
MNEINDGLQHIGICVWLNAMTQVEDMSGMCVVVVENFLCTAKCNVCACENESRVEISLNHCVFP